MTVRVAAVDLGASSGRVMIGEVGPDTLRLRAAARFPNDPLRLPDGLHWNLPGLYAAALAGLREAAAAGPLSAIGIDTWAVDYGLMVQGRLLGLPFHYRDEQRNRVGPESVHARLSHAELYPRNGLQYLPFNTLYQLAADPWAAHAERLLLVPDLLTYWLTGRQVAERTNASTTGLLDVTTGRWDTDLAARLGLPDGLFPELVDPGTRIGELLPHVREQVGTSAPVVAVGSHDTASAVVGVPIQTDDAAYLSLGTWGLVGLELDAPVLTEAARAANFTNEGGVDGKVRFLSNVMGTWVLSETLRSWHRAGEIGSPEDELPGLLAAAAAVDTPVPVIDVQDPRFSPPGDMSVRIAAWCAEHGVAPPEGKAALVRCLLESLAVAYADALGTAAELSGRSVGVLHVVGGGARNHLLCQLIADRAGVPVLAGPVEATALGNVLVQARAAGAVGPELSELRALVARTDPPVGFQPRTR
ncbi:rhamnulokinase [Nocardioides insulae]|uniref:rhamnulokinase n=1 Tax=Nocardioides insulae TaxID=394734 RepID=UPI00041DE502|nr:rhamnulokinase family protein [Nocardioides insulae]